MNLQNSISRHILGTPFTSVGRAGIPCTEALSSLQRSRVRVPAWGPLLRVAPPLSHPVSCRIFSCSINNNEKKGHILMYTILCICLVNHRWLFLIPSVVM